MFRPPSVLHPCSRGVSVLLRKRHEELTLPFFCPSGCTLPSTTTTRFTGRVGTFRTDDGTDGDGGGRMKRFTRTSSDVRVGPIPLPLDGVRGLRKICLDRRSSTRGMLTSKVHCSGFTHVYLTRIRVPLVTSFLTYSRSGFLFDPFLLIGLWVLQSGQIQKLQFSLSV